MTPEWVNILKRVGWPTEIVVLDFETYFDQKYTLKKLSTIEYIQSAQFEEHGVAVLGMSGKTPWAPVQAAFHHDVGADLQWLQGQYGERLERCTVVMHNARFDASILAFRHGIIPPFIIDTLDLANHIDSRAKNSLEDLCTRYNLPAKGDTKQFVGLHWSSKIEPASDGGPPVQQWRGMTDAEKEAMIEYANNDAEREFDLFALLLPRLSRIEIELPLARQTLDLFRRPCLKVDGHYAHELMSAMEAEVKKVLVNLNVDRETISGNISFQELLQNALGDEPVPMKAGKKKPVMALAKTDPERKQLENHPNAEVRKLVAARFAIKSWPLHIKRVRRVLDQSAGTHGFLPVPLRYYGGHTGRWAGGEGINLQNLTTRAEHQLVNRIRGVLSTAPGFCLAIADASQIEARQLAWLAGQRDLVDKFAAGAPIYCDFASAISGNHIRKVLPDDPPQIAAYLKHYRQMGKIGVLGCGYGMGWQKLIEYAHNTYKIDLTSEMANRIVGHYRATNLAITRFWCDVEYAFKYVTRYPTEDCTLARGLCFYRDETTTVIQLPSGRKLYYPGAEVVGTGRDEHITMPDPRKEGLHIYMWGGYLTENIIQAISRDILGEAMLTFDEWGGTRLSRVGLHVHDEIIAVVHVDWAEKALAKLIELLSRSPAWAPDCPLAAEGWIAERYGK